MGAVPSNSLLQRSTTGFSPLSQKIFSEIPRFAPVLLLLSNSKTICIAALILQNKALSTWNSLIQKSGFPKCIIMSGFCKSIQILTVGRPVIMLTCSSYFNMPSRSHDNLSSPILYYFTHSQKRKPSKESIIIQQIHLLHQNNRPVDNFCCVSTHDLVLVCLIATRQSTGRFLKY